MGNLRNLRDSIRVDFEKMISQWESTAEVWKDAVSLSFQKTHIDPIEPAIRQVLKQLDRIDEMMEKAQRDLR